MHSPQNDLVQDQTHNIHSSFLNAFQHLARESVSAFAAEGPFVSERTLATLLVALASCATITVQSHMQDLAPAHHNLVVQRGKGSDVSLVIEDPASGSVSGVTLWLIWSELLFETPDATTVRPSTVALIHRHVSSPLYQSEHEQLVGFYDVIGVVLSESPYSDMLRRLAHLPVLLLEVTAERQISDPFMIEREAQRRLAQLYGQREEINVHLGPDAALQA